LHILDDNPTTEDRLGFSDTVDALFEVITDAGRKQHLPLTVGVFGAWGCGKTSLMKMVERRLEEAGVKTVWFAAWKYDGKEVIWNALIQTIFYRMREDPSQQAAHRKDFRVKVLRMAKDLAIYATKVGTRLVPGGVLQEADVEAVLHLFASSADDSLFAFVNHFEADFAALTKEYVGADGYLVVFIDDLDRCLPENAIQVMEALKLYLDMANFVFVVGAEPAVVEEAIRRRYPENQLSPTEYLEKIVQVPIMVPRVRVRDALLLHPPGTRISIDDTEMFILVREGTRRNPRRVKRFFNAYEIASRRVDELPTERQRGLAKVLLTQLCFPDFYRRLRVDPGLFRKLSGNEENPSAWNTQDLARQYENGALRRFLRETRNTCPDAAEVRDWIRVSVADQELGSSDNGDDVSAEGE
jgi:KAP family P-loop domain